MTNDLFLCHTGADKDWTRAIGERLEKEQIDGRAAKVWFDEWDIAHGENIITKIDEGLKTSRFVGVVLSPAALAAEWPTAEWQSQVMNDPAGRRGRVLPILLHKFDPETKAPIEIPFALRILRRFDFSEPRRFDSELEALVAHLRGEKPQRGRGRLGGSIEVRRTSQDAPDRIQENLVSNLLPVIRLPVKTYSDLTTARQNADVWAACKDNKAPPFALSDGRLISFVAPQATDNPFRPLLSQADPHAEDTESLLKDKDRGRLVVQLLNKALREHTYALDIRRPKGEVEQYYCPIRTGKPRLFSWGTGRSRTLAKLVTRKGQTLGVHHAARMRFILLNMKLYLLVEPGWLFTTDGVTPIGGKDAGVLSTQWGGRERNASVLRNLLMWSLLLSKGASQIVLQTGGDEIVVRTTPAHSVASAGLESDQMRLDKFLGAEGAGEQVEQEQDELDHVVEQALSEEPEEDEGVSRSSEPDLEAGVEHAQGEEEGE